MEGPNTRSKCLEVGESMRGPYAVGFVHFVKFMCGARCCEDHMCDFPPFMGFQVLPTNYSQLE